MSVPASVVDLVALIRKSGAIDEQKLNDYIHRRQVSGELPADVQECTDDMVNEGVLTLFQAEQLLLGKYRGFMIGKYKLLERIGVGGMGQVFLCEHMYLKRRVALKVLPPSKAEQGSALGRFYREARASAALQHPNVVRTHDIDQDGNLHYIVMDYVDGPNLLEVVKRFGPLDYRRAISYVRQIALALDFAFKNQIIHRDVKPGNILIDRKGNARLLDLGLARFINDHSDQLTIQFDDKLVLGTADYVAPEQVADSHSVDTRADIYALGATLYFLLAGHPPFPEGTVRDKLLWHRSKDPVSMRKIRPEVPSWLVTVVEKMMEKDPKDRYQTPAQVATELEYRLPSSVPLPRPEEMPRLSPAALERIEETDGPIEIAAEAEMATTAVKKRVNAPPTPPPVSPPPRRQQTWTRNESEIDTGRNQAEHTPSASRRSALDAANPFSGGDIASAPRKRKPSPAVIVAVVASLVAVIAIAALIMMNR
jgi:serine/threonine protein kinase